MTKRQAKLAVQRKAVVIIRKSHSISVLGKNRRSRLTNRLIPIYELESTL